MRLNKIKRQKHTLQMSYNQQFHQNVLRIELEIIFK